MAYGFLVALAAKGRLSEADFDFTENEQLVHYDTNIVKHHSHSLVLTSSSLDKNFISYTEVGPWFIISIGTGYSGNPPTISVQIHLDDISIPSAEEIRRAFQCVFGQYAAVAFNPDSGEYFAVSDPTGIRSLFLYRTEKALLIASSIPMLNRLCSKCIQDPDEENQQFLFRYGYCLPTRNVIKDVQEIAPYQLLQANFIQSGQIHQHKPATSEGALSSSGTGNTKSNLQIPSNEHEGLLLKHLLEACSEQLGPAKKVGVLLGGFDSALVASLLVKLGVEVETYSFHYEANRYNQPFIHELSQILDIKHHSVEITPGMIRQGLEDYGKNCNWPTLWLNYVIQTQHLCQKMVNDGMQSCFSGDGCDTIFLGYPSTHRRGQFYQRLPNISVGTGRFLAYTFHALRLERALGHIGRVILSLISAATHPAKDRALYSFQLFDSHLQKQLTNSDVNTGTNIQEYFKRVQEQTANLSFERKLYLSKSYISPNRCKLVSASDLSGLAIHSPYMHPGVVKFAQNLPLEALRPNDSTSTREGKYLLMKMAENASLLPKEVIYQPKLAAISSPIDNWLAHDLRDFALQKCSSLPFDYNRDYVNSLLDEKWIEKMYKNNFSSDGVVSLASSLLLTYASFFE